MGGQGHYLVALGGQLIGLPAGWGGSCDDLSPSRTGTRALGWLTCWRGSSGSLGQGPCLAACRDPPGHRGVMAAEGSCSQNGAYLSAVPALSLGPSHPWDFPPPLGTKAHRLPGAGSLLCPLQLCDLRGNPAPLGASVSPPLLWAHCILFLPALKQR